MDELIDASGVVPAANQVEWTPFGWSPQLLEHGRSRGIQIQAYCPLSRTTRLGDEQLRGIADRHYRSPAQVLLRWDIQLGVVPLPKAARREHLAENLGALDFELSAEEMNELGRLNERYSALGVLPYA
jgi:diketogulonate reductase-like aldo/keto reductase